MVDYGKGKIYKIVVNNTEDEYRPYIGSTTKAYLSQRFVEHRKDYKRYKDGKRNSVSSFILFDKYGIENCEIILIENYPCNSKDELMARERHWYDNIENCNKCKPIRLQSEMLEIYKKSYRRELELHPDFYKQRYQKKLEQSPDLCKEQYKRTLELHPNHKEERKQNKYNCECGSYIRVADKSKHNKTKKHINYIETLTIKQDV